MVPGAGLEPARYCYRRILSPLRLPISPPGRLRLKVGFFSRDALRGRSIHDHYPQWERLSRGY